MYFMYVDESGDPGSYDTSKPEHLRASRHYIITGVIVPATEWRNYLTALVDMRRQIKLIYGFPVREELHGAELINPRGATVFSSIGSRARRVSLYHEALQSVANRLSQVRIINVNLDKLNPRSPAAVQHLGVDAIAWERLIQRFNTYLQRSCNNSLGLIFGDQTNEIMVRRLCPHPHETLAEFITSKKRMRPLQAGAFFAADHLPLG